MFVLVADHLEQSLLQLQKRQVGGLLQLHIVCFQCALVFYLLRLE